MPYRLLADVVLLLHLAFIVFAVLGGLLALRWRWTLWVHLPAAAWAALVEIMRWPCPLTPLENWLRRAGGAQPYESGFVEHYVLPTIYPAGLTQEFQLVLAAAVVAVNAGVYALVWKFRSQPMRAR